MSEENKSKPLSETEQAAALNKAFDESKLTFHNRAEALAAFKRDREIVYEGEQPFALYDGVVQPLGDAFAKFGADNRGYIDGRSMPRQGVDASRPVLSKADLKTVQEKTAFVNEFGADAFEMLPLKSVDSSEVRTFEQWLKLPPAEKSRLISLDSNVVSKLAPTPPSRPNGVWQKPGLMEELKRKNPNYRGPGWSRDAMKKVS